MNRWPAGLMLILSLAACAAPPVPTPAVDPGVWFVEVEREGGCWLDPETLQTLGADPLGETPPPLRLSWAGRPVPYLPLRTEEGWGLFFFAPDRSTRYTRRTAFRLEVGATGEVMPLEEPPAAASSPAGGLASLRWEEDRRYLPQADAESPWFWEPLYAPGAVTHTLTLTGALSGPVTVTLHLWSHTAFPANPDHLLRLRWDSRTVGEWEWDGQGMQHLTASWEEGQPEGEHTLAIETPRVPGVDVALVWLDGWDVTYRRRVEASGAVWQAEGATLRVEETGPGVRLLDVTDPFSPLNLDLVPAGGTVKVVPAHRYWVGKPEEVPGPLAVRPVRAVGQVANLSYLSYLALAPPEFHASLQPLLEHRRSQGLEAAVVDIQAVYDIFGSGRPDPEAVRTLVQSLPALRYLLLVGDGTAEPWGYDGEAGALRVVAPLTRTTRLGETPADSLLGTGRQGRPFDCALRQAQDIAQGRPVVPVGRFPAASPDEVTAMVGKTIRWETQEHPPAVLLLSDDEPEFAALVEEIASLLPAGSQVQRLDAGDDGSRAEALEALSGGPVWLNYAGHGSLTLLGDEGLLTVEDGETWREPALVVAWTCLAAHFIHPTQASMAEVWLRSPRGGAVAFLGPVGETTTGEQEPFVEAFYRALLEKERLGDAWLAALRLCPSTGSGHRSGQALQENGSQDVAWGYVLLGDPALRLRLE